MKPGQLRVQRRLQRQLEGLIGRLEVTSGLAQPPKEAQSPGSAMKKAAEGATKRGGDLADVTVPTAEQLEILDRYIARLEGVAFGDGAAPMAAAAAAATSESPPPRPQTRPSRTRLAFPAASAAASETEAARVRIETPLVPINDAVLELCPPLLGLESGNRFGVLLEALDETDTKDESGGKSNGAGGLVVVSALMQIAGADGFEIGLAHAIGVSEAFELLETLKPHLPTHVLDVTGQINVEESLSREEARVAAAMGAERALALEAFVAAHPEVLEAFERIDSNKDGSLSRAEVIKSCRRDAITRELLGLPATIRQEDGSRDVFEEVFQQFDIDHSKTIERDEFLQIIADRMGYFATDDDDDADDADANATVILGGPSAVAAEDVREGAPPPVRMRMPSRKSSFGEPKPSAEKGAAGPANPSRQPSVAASASPARMRMPSRARSFAEPKQSPEKRAVEAVAETKEAAAEKEDVDDGSLPVGWKEHRLFDGRTYYWHETRPQDVTWARPTKRTPLPVANDRASTPIDAIGRFFQAAFFIEALQKPGPTEIADEDGEDGPMPAGSPRRSARTPSREEGEQQQSTNPLENLGRSASKLLGTFLHSDAKVAGDI